MTEIEVGDLVYLGSGKVHWEVEWITEWCGSVVLKSGMSGRKRSAFLHELTLYQKAKVPA